MEQLEYTPKQLADLSGLSVRALHHYDDIGLLRARRHANGYRFYGPAEVDRLQLVMIYRACGMRLHDIGACLDDPSTDVVAQLATRRAALVEQREQTSRLIQTIDWTMASTKGATTMTDAEKFEGLKHDLVRTNEETYGEEARRMYGDEAVDASNAKLLGMSLEQYEQTRTLQDQIADGLREAMASGEGPSSPAALRVADLHRQWLCHFWKSGTYSKAAHAGLAEGYLADERFRAFYDAVEPGATQFLHDAILAYCAQ